VNLPATILTANPQRAAETCGYSASRMDNELPALLSSWKRTVAAELQEKAAENAVNLAGQSPLPA
jgi:hypothetical protein